MALETNRIDSFLHHRIYFDSNLFIYLVEKIAPYATILREFVNAAESKELIIVTSDLTLSEVLVKPIERKNLIQQRAFLSVLRYAPRLGRIAISEEILIRAAGIRAEHKTLKLPDAIHMATAQWAGCDDFLTNDERIPDASDLSFGKTKILNKPVPVQGTPR
uniref:Predicted nucleic acid-binding protein, contains PIN domain n=1 Tax=Candidatus Kentrum sp. LPFa TaxID=2126335 RepID=A0A450XUB5_9GAMM|nr:MAG: Predicted nucleic acid-binding protein, contains PIN domain [Candidatus Kentron sp. LPFa]VFK32858.1 MAG: Predicted nucleic acid-binding protein, contains PIN domain [Candidatus Kentron sp. LPFa]